MFLISFFSSTDFICICFCCFFYLLSSYFVQLSIPTKFVPSVPVSWQVTAAPLRFRCHFLFLLDVTYIVFSSEFKTIDIKLTLVYVGPALVFRTRFLCALCFSSFRNCRLFSYFFISFTSDVLFVLLFLLCFLLTKPSLFFLCET